MSDPPAGSWTAEEEVKVVLPAGEPPQQMPHTQKGVSQGTRTSEPEPKPNVAAGEEEDAEPADATKKTLLAGDQSPITQIANLTATIKILRERVSEEQSRTAEVAKKLDLQLSRLATEKALVVGMVRRAAMGESEGLSATLQGMKAAGWESLPAMLAFHREQERFIAYVEGAHSQAGSEPVVRVLPVLKSVRNELSFAVIVYSDRADITRQVSVEMVQGVNEVIFWNITSSLMHDSVRVT
eukprot:gene13104-15475_t